MYMYIYIFFEPRILTYNVLKPEPSPEFRIQSTKP